MTPDTRRRRGPASRALSTTALTALTVLLGCGSEPPALEVAGVTFSQEDVLGISPTRLELLRSLTRFGVAAQAGELEAVAAPLAAEAEVLDLGRALRVDELLAEAQVDDAVLRERYRTNPSWELTVRHLVVLSERYEGEEAREAARDRAAAALARVRAGEAFPQVAGEVSEEPGAADRGGLLQPGREGTWVEEFWSAASALEVGEVSPVIETPFGFHVLRLDGRDTVPFLEERRRVAAEVGALIATLPASIDELPLPEGLGAAGVDADGLEDGGDASSGTGPAARFEGGTVSQAEVRRWAATLPADRWDAFEAGDPGARNEALQRAARAAHARIRATAAGISPQDALGAATREDWVRQAQGWGASLGLVPGLPGEDALREAALEALGRSGQLPELARQEIHRARPLLQLHQERP